MIDVTLVVGDSEILVDRRKLIEASPYFTAMFEGPFKESHSRRVELLGIDDPGAFAIVLNYILGERIDWKENEHLICPALKLADMMLVEKLISEVRNLCDTGWKHFQDAGVLLEASRYFKIEEQVSTRVEKFIQDLISKMTVILPIFLKPEQTQICKEVHEEGLLENRAACQSSIQLGILLGDLGYRRNHSSLTSKYSGFAALDGDFFKSVFRSGMLGDYHIPKSGVPRWRACLWWLLQQQPEDDLYRNAVNWIGTRWVPAMVFKDMISKHGRNAASRKLVQRFVNESVRRERQLILADHLQDLVVVASEDKQLFCFDREKWTWRKMSWMEVSDLSWIEFRRIYGEQEEVKFLCSSYFHHCSGKPCRCSYDRVELYFVKSKDKTMGARALLSSESTVIRLRVPDKLERCEELACREEILTEVPRFMRNLVHDLHFCEKGPSYLFGSLVYDDHLYISGWYVSTDYNLNIRRKKFFLSAYLISERSLLRKCIIALPRAEIQSCQLARIGTSIYGFFSVNHSDSGHIGWFTQSTTSMDVNLEVIEWKVLMKYEGYTVMVLSAICNSDYVTLLLSRGDKLTLYRETNLWLIRFNYETTSVIPIGFLPPLPVPLLARAPVYTPGDKTEPSAENTVQRKTFKCVFAVL